MVNANGEESDPEREGERESEEGWTVDALKTEITVQCRVFSGS